MPDDARTADRPRSARSRRSAILGAVGLLGGLAGCLSGSPSDADSTGTPTATTVTGGSATATTAATSTATTTTATPRPCYASTPSVDVEVPARPDELTADAALSLAVEFETAYTRANLAATYDLARYSQYVVDRRTGVESTEDGYRVRVKVHSDFATSGDGTATAITASGGYQHEYLVTERRFVREGKTLACWSEG